MISNIDKVIILDSPSKVKERLIGMRDRWGMWDITRDAFLTRAVCYLECIGIDGRILYQQLLSIKGTSAADVESARTVMDEEFAKKVIEEALKLLPATNLMDHIPHTNC